MKVGPAIIVHGGAGSGVYRENDRRYRVLKEAVVSGMGAMRKGGSIDGVEAAVNHLEASGLFNAGRGACLTALGEPQLDAAIMTGEGRRGAGVGVCTCTYQPVTLARKVMELTGHVLVAGGYCRFYAKKAGMTVEEIYPSPASRKRYLELKTKLRTSHPRTYDLLRSTQDGNTVGAVAIDGAGVPSAAVSTGGMWMKLPGRIGDSAILGAGIYADTESGAACATGTGEEIIKCSLAWNACREVLRGGAQRGADDAIALITQRAGTHTAGIITVDLKGRVGFARNTEAMGLAWLDGRSERVNLGI